MSCESYLHNREVYHVGFDHQGQKGDMPLLFDDDHELLEYLLEQEHKAEQDLTVSYDSYTND